MKRSFLLIILVFLCGMFFTTCGSLERVEREKFTVNLNSPRIPVGEIELQFDRFMSMRGLRKDKVTVLYFPREDAVCLQYRHEYITYHQFWSRRGRFEFITALEKYITDYEERTLDRKDKRSKRHYSTFNGYLIWQMYSFTVQARANVNMELGYVFKDNAPYFTVNQRQAEFKEEHARDSNRTSPAVTMYFTRAQAAQLAEFFDQEFLQSLTQTDLSPKESEQESAVDRDEY